VFTKINEKLYNKLEDIKKELEEAIKKEWSKKNKVKVIDLYGLNPSFIEFLEKRKNEKQY